MAPSSASSSVKPGQGDPAPTSNVHCTLSPQMDVFSVLEGNVCLVERAERVPPDWLRESLKGLEKGNEEQ